MFVLMPTFFAIFTDHVRSSKENMPVVPPLLGSVAMMPESFASIQSPIIETDATFSYCVGSLFLSHSKRGNAPSAKVCPDSW